MHCDAPLQHGALAGPRDDSKSFRPACSAVAPASQALVVPGVASLAADELARLVSMER